ncbi:MAG: hypothetical protein Athens071416_303 [Parcubacteria group bacterium Athens0714_16]|nr:MAG: hypothetical protein Athens071416_303 [Parcubacteria group bacterium Athens0714_16]
MFRLKILAYNGGLHHKNFYYGQYRGKSSFSKTNDPVETDAKAESIS